ncbi:MAG: hypothetical protein ACM3QS_14875 [Bacteroidota bacterium]
MLLIPLAALLVLSACQPATPPPAIPPLPPAASPVVGAITPEAAAQELVKLSQNLLNEQFQIAPGDIAVTEVTPMTWPDASLGCPKIGVMYIQVVTPGYQIVLQAKDHTFTFHTDAKSQVVLCSVNPPDAAYPTPSSP